MPKKNKLKKGVDLSKLLASDKDEWIALSSDETRIVGRGRTLEEAYKKAIQRGEEDPIMTHTLRPGDYFF